MTDKFSYLGNSDPTAIEALYKQYLQHPESVEESWKDFFGGFDFARKQYDETGEIPENFDKEFKVLNLIHGYRSRGHLFTKTNPVRERRKYTPTLDLENFGLSDKDLDTVFQAGNEVGIGKTTLREIIAHLQLFYCQSIGLEYMYIRNPEIIDWLRKNIEFAQTTPISKEGHVHILNKLSQAVVFEQFLHKKFVGQKRFSIEGAEVLIPTLDALIEHGSTTGIEEFVIGMSHRGRLNVLANILNKTYEEIFNEFEGKEFEDQQFDGDVKYHLGYSSYFKTETGNKVKLTLSPNPSHLEAVDAVVQGITRAKNDHYIKDENKIVPILIHGDAAIAGQGIVYEVVQMAQLKGFKNGGTVHIVVNNQIGFTTNYIDARSSTYCTDVAKVTLSPVFHVNGDDVEAMIKTIKMALEYRQAFHKDVFIDMLCYRKYGHNEGDEPRFTQPILYKLIDQHPNAREIYLKRLEEQSIINSDEAKAFENKFDELLQNRLDESKQIPKAHITDFLEDTWKNIRPATPQDFHASPETGYDKKKLIELGKKIATLPEDKPFYRKIKKLIDERYKMITETETLDWGMGELLAYATLLDEGFPVRLTGQDCERGTFSHRHAVIRIDDSTDSYVPLQNLNKKQADFHIYNSLLSEYGVLGFEYGYGMATPNGLTIWEAQFGDFYNGAQIIVDQFISAAEEKWHSMNSLVMFLPHGYEGQGSEHSSARIERFLLMCAKENMQVANCTTPANFYHILRRQLHRPFRKPLIIFTPKSLLRHPKCVSKLDELAKGKFLEVIDDVEIKDKKQINTVVLCSGKFYYDLREKREELGANDIAFIRIEQLYPFPEKQLDNIISQYQNTKKIVWAQEEPENMGAWIHIMRFYTSHKLGKITLHAGASPATGSHKAFDARHSNLINKVFEHSLVTK